MSVYNAPERNREGWLTELALMIQPIFKGFKIEPYRVSCSWPSKMAIPGKGGVRVGECHGPKGNKAGVYEIFITPLKDDPLEVAGIVCHEMAHVVAGIDAQHGSRFKMVCKHAGIVKGKPTAAEPGPALNDLLKRHLEALGPYPHSAIQLKQKEVKLKSSVSLKCKCGCRISISFKWLEEAGVPTCGCGGSFLNVLKEEDDDGD